MRKGYILVDVPTQCSSCDLCHEEEYDGSRKIHGDMLCGGSGCKVNSHYFNKTKPDWCPIREFPERKEPSQFTVNHLPSWQYTEYKKGWNDCLEQMEVE